jgi:hypothetical protein
MALLNDFEPLDNDPVQDIRRQDRNALVSGVSSGIDDLQGLGYSGIAAIGDLVGSNKIKNWGEEGADRNSIESRLNGRPDLEKIEDISWGNAAPMLAYQIGKQLPNLAGSVATAIALPEVAIPAALARGAAFVPRILGGGGAAALEAGSSFAARRAALEGGKDLARAITGGAAFNYGTGVGSMYDSASENPEDKSPGATAFLGAVPHALAETIPQAMLFGKLANGSGASGNLLTRMGKNFAVQGASGATSELTQGELEMAVGKPLTDDEKFSQRLNAGVIGGVVEGVMGLPAGFRGRRPSAGGAIGAAINENDFTNTSSLTPEQIAANSQAKAVASIGPQLLTPEQIKQNEADSAAVAAANIQKQQADAAAAAQQTQASHDAGFATVAGTFGVRPTMGADGNPTGQFSIGSKPIFTQNDAKAFIVGLEKASSNMSPEQKTLIGAVINSGAVQVTPDANPKGVVNAVTAYLKKNQLDTAANPAEVISRIDAQIDAIPASEDIRLDGKGAKFANELNKLHKELTGADSPARERAVARNDAHQAEVAKAEADKQAAKQATKDAKKTPTGKPAAKSASTAVATTAATPVATDTKVDSTAPSAVTTATSDAVKEAQARLDAANAATDPLYAPAVELIQKNNRASVSLIQRHFRVDYKRAQDLLGQMERAGLVSPAAPDGLRTLLTQNTTGASNEGLQNTAGLGEVPEQSGTNETSGNQIGLIRSTGVQPVGAGSIVAGSNGEQNDTSGDGGDGQRAVLTPDANISNDGSQTQEINPAPKLTSSGKLIGSKGRAPRKDDTNGQTTDRPAAGSGTAGTGLSIDTSGTRIVVRSDSQTGDAGARQDGDTQLDRDIQGNSTGLRTQSTQESERPLVEIEAEKTRSFIGDFLLRVFRHATPQGQDLEAKAKFFQENWGRALADRNNTQAEIAKELGVTESQIKKWSADIPRNSGDISRWLAKYATSLNAIGSSIQLPEGMTPTDLYQALIAPSEVTKWIESADRENEKSEIQQFLEDGSGVRGFEQESVLGDGSIDSEGNIESNVNIRTGSTGASKSEFGNTNEAAAAKWEALQAANDAAHEAGDQDLVESTQKALDDFETKQATANIKAAKKNLSKKETGTEKPKKVTTPRKVAAEKTTEKAAPAQTAAVGETRKDVASRSWDKAVAVIPGAKKFSELTEKQQSDFAAFDLPSQKLADVVKFMEKNGLVPKDDAIQNSTSNTSTNGETETVASANAAVKEFVGTLNESRLVVVESVEQLPADIRNHPKFDANSRGVVAGGKAYLIAGNIPKGMTRAVFLHEVGSHLGIQRLLNDAQFDKLVDSIVAWAGKQDDSIESKIAVKALGRVFSANASDNQRNTELVAYFLEEAINMGVDPTALSYKSELGRWFRSVYAAMKAAIRKLGFNPEKLTAQDMVDMAYGAAKLEMSGSWHGTAASFRKFNHAFMNSGEGAQAFGWGTYAAQRFGIGQGYRVRDIKNKGRQSDTNQGSLHRVDSNIADYEWLDYDAPMSEQSDHVKQAVEKIRSEIGQENFDDYLDQINIDATEMTGKDLYKILERASRDDTIPSNNPDVLDAQEQGQDDRAASMYLDEHGVKGLKFLDDPSRSGNLVRKRTARYTRDVQAAEVLLQESKDELEKYIAEKPSEWELKHPVSLAGFYISKDKWLPKRQEDVTRAEQYLAERKKRLADYVAKHPEVKTATRNSVIFNDKNIQRVATARNGDVGDMQFSLPAKGVVAKNIAKLPPNAQLYYKSFAEQIQRGVMALSFTKDLVARAEKYMPSAVSYMRAMGEQVAIRNDERRAVEKIGQSFEALSAADQRSVNALIKESTRNKRWAFTPSWLTNASTGQNTAKVDPGLELAYKNLTTDAARQVVRNVFAHGYSSMKQIQHQIEDTTIANYDIGIANARAVGDVKEVKRLEDEKDFELGHLNSVMNIRGENPYAPLGRFGDHVVTMRSPEMMMNQDILNNRKSGQYDEAAIKAAQKFVNKNRDDPKHFQVHFAENGVQAAKIEEQLKKYGETQSFMKDDAANKFGGKEMQGLLYRTRSLANKKDEDDLSASHRAINNLLTQLHLQLLSEQSARHSEHHRDDIAGATNNMMRSFYQHGVANASFLAGLHKSKEIQDSLDGMKKEAEDITTDNRMERQDLHNEILTRHGMGIESKENKLVGKILKANSVMQLLTKPLYYVQNAMQPWTMSLPYLAGRFQGQAVSAMLTAYKDVGAVMAGNNLTRDVLDKLPKDVQKAVHELMERGELNVDLDQEMGDRLKGTDAFSRVTSKLQTMAERVEGINRVTTAVAAYRLAKPTMGHDAAVKYAGKTVYDTHGDYSGFNAPRIMRTQTGRVLTQFRKFQMVQLSLMVKLGQQAFTGASKEERAVGKYALGYTLGTAFTFGGLMALPGYKAIAWMVGKIMSDGDEPDDPEAQEARMRRAIGDTGLANFLLKGVPKSLGMDMEPIFGGFGGMLSLLPYTKIEDASRSTAENILLGMAGPTAGLAAKTFEGMGKMADGDFIGGLQKALPTGIANIVKAFDQQEKGLTRANGATILSPAEVGVFDSMMTAVGLKTNTLADKEFINRVETTYEAYYRKETQKVEHDYVQAYKKGDSAAMQDARERWTEINASRRDLGFKTQPMSQLFKAPQAARKYDQRTTKNLQTSGVKAAGYAN